MKFAYLTSLVLAAAINTASPHAVSAAITAEQDSATKINVSGRQRMLS